MTRVALLALAAVLVTTFAGLGGPPRKAEAQGASCSATTVTGQGDGRFAIADVGNAIASFVCLGTSTGQRGPFTTNGRTADNCFTIDGVGTSVARAVKTDPAIIPGCPDLIRIDVGVTTQIGPTATATTGTSPTATPTTNASPTATATRIPAASPTATTPPPPPTAVVPTATSTARPPAPLPPATGTGATGNGGFGGGQLGLAVFALAIGAGGGIAIARTRACR